MKIFIIRTIGTHCFKPLNHLVQSVANFMRILTQALQALLNQFHLLNSFIDFGRILCSLGQCFFRLACQHKATYRQCRTRHDTTQSNHSACHSKSTSRQ